MFLHVSVPCKFLRAVTNGLFLSPQTILHKLFHSMLVNTGSREPVLSFLGRIIRLNHRRAQIHVEEQLVAGDGAMVNLVSVLQQLCFRVGIVCTPIVTPSTLSP